VTIIALVGILYPTKTHGGRSEALQWINPLESLSDKPNLASLKSAISYISVQYDLSYDDLVRVINCESSFNINAKNPYSTASGIAQFIDSTWEHYCEGDKDSPKNQLRCMGLMWSKGYQSHWECF